jgi:parallel beta-helix repeat protein
MLRFCLIATVALVVCLYPMSAAPQDSIKEPPGSLEPRTVEVPSEECPTIQSAIDLLPNGSEILLQPGRYTESITLRGKTINFIGTGTFFRPTVIVGADPERAVITCGAGGGGSFEGMALVGGSCGIEGIEEEVSRGDVTYTIPPGRISLYEMVIAATGQGIYGNFSELMMLNSFVGFTDWNGVTILSADRVDLLNSLIWNTENVGVYIFNLAPAGKIKISDDIIVFNDECGIVVLGDGSPVEITNCYISSNGTAGILLMDVGNVLIDDCTVQNTDAVDTPEHEGIGDGLIAVSETSSAHVYVRNSRFRFHDRAGLLFVNSGGSVENTTSTVNMYGLVVQGNPRPDCSHAGNYFSGSEEDVVSDGDLPVPDQPLPVPETMNGK